MLISVMYEHVCEPVIRQGDKLITISLSIVNMYTCHAELRDGTPCVIMTIRTGLSVRVTCGGSRSRKKGDGQEGVDSTRAELGCLPSENMCRTYRCL